jgi:DNA integrity scanning protein DisA with diadenylate cyclase activity
MERVSRHIFRYARHLAREVSARALVITADAIPWDAELRQLLQAIDFPTILVTRDREGLALPDAGRHTWITLPNVAMTRAAQVRATLLVCLARKVVDPGDRVVFLTGVDGSGALDALVVFTMGRDPDIFSLAGSAPFAEDVAPEVFERVLSLAAELAAEGREGRPVGTLFVVGDSERVLAQSRSLVLNPFQGHPEGQRNILDPALEETVKEFSALDGAFVVRGDGVILSAGTQLVPTAPHPPLPGGLGTRHAAAAGITASTDAVAVCVSQSTGAVTVFKSGQMVTNIHRTPARTRLAG